MDARNEMHGRNEQFSAFENCASEKDTLASRERSAIKLINRVC